MDIREYRRQMAKLPGVSAVRAKRAVKRYEIAMRATGFNSTYMLPEEWAALRVWQVVGLLPSHKAAMVWEPATYASFFPQLVRASRAYKYWPGDGKTYGGTP